MKKIQIASVTLLVIGKVSVYVMVDSVNRVCKFHVDYDGNLDVDSRFKLSEQLHSFVYSLCPDDYSNLQFSEASKDEVFKYLPSKFC